MAYAPFCQVQHAKRAFDAKVTPGRLWRRCGAGTCRSKLISVAEPYPYYVAIMAFNGQLDQAGIVCVGDDVNEDQQGLSKDEEETTSINEELSEEEDEDIVE